MNNIAPPWTRHTSTIIELALLDNKNAREGRPALELSNYQYAAKFGSVHINLGVCAGNTYYATRKWREGAVLVLGRREMKNLYQRKYPEANQDLIFSQQEWLSTYYGRREIFPEKSLIIFDRGGYPLSFEGVEKIYWPSERSRDHTYLFLG